MSWIWPDYIDRDMRLSTGKRKAIHRDAWRLWWRNRWNVLLYLCVPAVYLIGISFVGDLVADVGTALGLPWVVYKLCRAGAPVVVFIICFVGGGAVLQRTRFAPCVFRATRRHGYDVCPGCGYWLRGLGDETRNCPECGAQRESMSAGAGASRQNEVIHDSQAAELSVWRKAIVVLIVIACGSAGFVVAWCFLVPEVESTLRWLGMPDLLTRGTGMLLLFGLTFMTAMIGLEFGQRLIGGGAQTKGDE